MGTYRLFLACLSLLAVSSAQQAQPDRFKVEGVVVNSVTAKPLPRVLVQIYGHSMLTGPEGQFSFEGVPAGRVQIQLMKPGYFGPGGPSMNQWFMSMGKMAGDNIEIGPDTGKIVLKLSPEAVISGRVTGQDEEPLEGASVEVLIYVWQEGRQVLVPVRGNAQTNAQTGEDGNFRIAGLSPGRYYVAVKSGNVSRRVLGAQTSKSSESYPAVVYYPGAADLASAAAIDILPGQKIEAQFSLSRSPAYKLAGKVVAAGEWKRINQPMIVDSLDQGLFAAEQFDASSGAFEFRAVPAGTYTIRVGGWDNHDRYRFSDRKVTISQSVTNLQLSLQPGVNIPVVARAQFNKPLPQAGSCGWSDNAGVHQSDCSDFPAARVELISMESAHLRFATDYRPVQDPSDFVVPAVTPGKYMVRAQPGVGGYGYVQSVRSGNLDLLHEVLTVPEDGKVAPIEVVMRDDPGTIKVTVHAQKPGQQATVVVFPDGALFLSGNMMRNTGAEVYFPPMAPGSYKVLAFDSVDGLVLDDPEVLAKYVTKATNVTVTANGNANVMVDVIHNGDGE
jgi:hypothetical protein